MLSITSTQLETWLATLIYPLTRILAIVASSPILGNKQVPVRIKVSLSILLSFIITPNISSIPHVTVGSAQGLLILVQEIIIGAAIGFSIKIIFDAIELAGELTGLQMGLGFASFFDPINAVHSAIIAQWMGIIAALLFVALDGHLYIISAIAESFQALPIGNMIQSQGLYGIVQWGGSIFAYALQISLPIMAALLITNLALGILTRAAPQLNLFAVGFPITLAIGLVALTLTTPYLSSMLDRLTHEGISTSLKLIKPIAHQR